MPHRTTSSFPPASLVIEVDISQQNSQDREFFNPLTGEFQHILGRQSRKERPNTPLSIVLATAHCHAFYRATVSISFFSHPTYLAFRTARIIEPCDHALSQMLSTRSRVILAMKLIATLQNPVDLIDTATPRIPPAEWYADAFLHPRPVPGSLPQLRPGGAELSSIGFYHRKAVWPRSLHSV